MKFFQTTCGDLMVIYHGRNKTHLETNPSTWAIHSLDCHVSDFVRCLSPMHGWQHRRQWHCTQSFDWASWCVTRKPWNNFTFCWTNICRWWQTWRNKFSPFFESFFWWQNKSTKNPRTFIKRSITTNGGGVVGCESVLLWRYVRGCHLIDHNDWSIEISSH